MKKAAWIVVCLLTLSISAHAQDCDQARSKATWKNTTLSVLTYKCIPVGWEAFFNDPAVKAEVKRISNALRKEVRDTGGDVNPALGNVFRALYSVSPSNVRAVVLGQDPAPTRGQATGLSFSLAPGTAPWRVPSVQRAILEARNEGFSVNVDDGDLSSWATHGVVLLNTALTIPCPASAGSCTIGGHLALWKTFTAQLLKAVDAEASPQAIILWGSKAASFKSHFVNPLHRVFLGGHPSPLSDPSKFFCKSYFSCSNKWLDDHHVSQIEWSVTGGSTSAQSCIWSRGKTPTCATACTQAACD
jgi:uracil-DNA glycosylase